MCSAIIKAVFTSTQTSRWFMVAYKFRSIVFVSVIQNRPVITTENDYRVVQ